METSGPNRALLVIAGLLGVSSLFATLTVFVFMIPQDAPASRIYFLLVPLVLFLSAVVVAWLSWVTRTEPRVTRPGSG